MVKERHADRRHAAAPSRLAAAQPCNRIGHLELRTFIAATSEQSRSERRLRTRARSARQARFVGAAVICASAFCIVSLCSSAFHAAVPGGRASGYTVIQVRVAAGDSLWKYAERYGDPNTYILERVDSIAQENGISAQAPLTRGQVLSVAVENPVQIALIDRKLSSKNEQVAGP